MSEIALIVLLIWEDVFVDYISTGQEFLNVTGIHFFKLTLFLLRTGLSLLGCYFKNDTVIFWLLRNFSFFIGFVL